MRVAIITPALADANNGNWQTAARWRRFAADPLLAARLSRRRLRVDCSRDWDGAPADLMIALHARRSADSIARFKAAHDAPVVLVLTGTDLYRDIADDPAARRSLALADRLVCLQERGPLALEPALRAKTEVIFQSAPTCAPLPPRRRSFDLLLVGHLRPEKDPLTAVAALRSLPEPDLRLIQIGGPADPATAAAVADAAAADPRIRCLGALPHGRTRHWIRRARALLLPSRMEGGANVLIEAVTSDTPVLASRIDGSVGMLGVDYAGYFPLGDAAALARLVGRLRGEPGFGDRLRRQARTRAVLFRPQAERERVQALIASLLAA